jgi:hypothetical protein
MRRWFENEQPACMADDAIARRVSDVVDGARRLLEQKALALRARASCRSEAER